MRSPKALRKRYFNYRLRFRGDKLLYYRSIPEFKEYLLVSQGKYFLEHYRKTVEGQWLLQEYRGDEKEIVLESVGVSLAVKDAYEGVNLKIEKG